MKVEWNYTELAASYVDRPAYSKIGLEEVLRISGLNCGDRACDIGAGVAHLTIPLLEAGLIVDAVEPNDAMRNLGIKRTAQFDNVTWHEGTGEETGMPEKTFEIATFGSSFNVTDRTKAMNEVIRIVKPKGWFVCMWNHRNLDDPLQLEVENIIKSYVDAYDYGTRREDQSEIIRNSGLFENLEKIEAPVGHTVSAENWVNAWRSHATLQRQVGDKFTQVVDEIGALVSSKGQEELTIPYTTRIWISRIK